jgi:histidinol-phosphatase
MADAADLDLALSLADEADRMSLERFRAADLTVETKPDLTWVSEADKAVELRLRDLLAEARPSDDILGEEFGGQDATGRQWIIDPIDGTANYVRGVPVWATLIALTTRTTVSLGVVSAPALGRRWWARVGQGAFLREGSGEPRRLHVSAVHRLDDASLSYSDTRGWPERGLAHLIRHTWRQRAYGDFWSHMLVAEGAVDIAVEPSLAVHDMAALVPIVREAGGRMTDLHGTPAPWGPGAVTTNGRLHDEVLHVLRH